MRKALQVGLVSAGILLIGSSAEAAQNWTSAGNVGILSGNQVYLPIQAPINLCGNAIGVLGNASAGCQGGAIAQIPGTMPIPYDGPNRTLDQKKHKQGQWFHHDNGTCDLNWVTSGNVGILNGNQVHAPIQLPIDVSGNAIGVLGGANAWSTGGSTATYC